MSAFPSVKSVPPPPPKMQRYNDGNTRRAESSRIPGPTHPRGSLHGDAPLPASRQFPAPSPAPALTVLEEALLVQHGDGVHAQQGRLQQGIQREGHCHPKQCRTDSFPDAARDVAPPPRPATGARAAQTALTEEPRPLWLSPASSDRAPPSAKYHHLGASHRES